jgi:hypothetical protein
MEELENLVLKTHPVLIARRYHWRGVGQEVVLTHCMISPVPSFIESGRKDFPEERLLERLLCVLVSPEEVVSS